MPKFIIVGKSSINLEDVKRININKFGEDKWQLEVKMKDAKSFHDNAYETYDKIEDAEKKRDEIMALLNA